MRTRSIEQKSDLQDAVATLVRTQAAFVSEMAEINKRHTELERRTETRFIAIEQLLHEIVEAIQQLPEAIRQKIGFKAK